MWNVIRFISYTHETDILSLQTILFVYIILYTPLSDPIELELKSLEW